MGLWVLGGLEGKGEWVRGIKGGGNWGIGDLGRTGIGYFWDKEVRGEILRGELGKLVVLMYVCMCVNL